MLVVGMVRAFRGTLGPCLCVWGVGCVHVGGGHGEGFQRDPGSLFVWGGGGGGEGVHVGDGHGEGFQRDPGSLFVCVGGRVRVFMLMVGMVSAFGGTQGPCLCVCVGGGGVGFMLVVGMVRAFGGTQGP